MTFQAGSEKQHAYITKMAADAGFASTRAACAHVLERSEEDLGELTLSTSDARRVIEHLQVATNRSDPNDTAGNRESRNYTTAKQLRAYATKAQVPPVYLDDHAVWVLDRLGKLGAIELVLAGKGHSLSPVVNARGVNGNGPITIEHLLSYYDNDWDKLAEAFRVAVPSAKAWGACLPEARWFEAEVKTGGYVRVPRDAKGQVK